MKVRILILLLFPIFCFAQTNSTTEEKPATDACPDFKSKGKNPGKADYFKFLRSPKKAKEGQTINGVYYPASAQQPGTSGTQPRNPYIKATSQIPVAETTPNEDVEEKTEEVEEPIVATVTKKEEEKTEEIETAESETIETKETPEKTTKDNTKKEKKVKKRMRNTSSGKVKKVRKSKNAKCPDF